MALAPPFNRDNAIEKGRLGGQRSGEVRRALKRAKAELERACNPNEAQVRAMKQVDKVLDWMDDEEDRDRYAQLTTMLDRVWNKAFPTQAAVRSRPQRRSLDSLGASPSIQPVVVEPVKPSTGSVSG